MRKHSASDSRKAMGAAARAARKALEAASCFNTGKLSLLDLGFVMVFKIFGFWNIYMVFQGL